MFDIRGLSVGAGSVEAEHVMLWVIEGQIWGYCSVA